MTEFPQDALGTLDWALISAPYRKDAVLMVSLLSQHGLRGEAATLEDLSDLLAQAPGVLVVTHEALNPTAIDIIGRFVESQPNWSEIPIVVLVDRSAAQLRIQAALSSAWPRSRQIFYQRPVAALELVSGIQSALLARFRQREVRDSLERERELRLELNHRVKNILASVISIFQMTKRGASSVSSLSEDFGGRIAALSNVHSAVFLAGGEAVSFSAVAGSTLAPYRSGEPPAIRLEGPDVTISREAATTIALCLHELATNAIKYGALSQPEGRIDLEWTLTAETDPVVTIRWSEIGGPPVVEPSRIGYGTRYIRSALTSLFGERPEIVFSPEGLLCTVRGPLSRIAPHL